MLALFRLDGRNAVVTGASRNMGRAIALAIADAGADVAVVDLPSEADAASGTVAAIEARRRRSAFVALDIRDVAAIPPAVGEIEARLGPIHVLVNNAGKTDDVPTPVVGYEEDVFDDHQQIMVRGTFFVSQAVARRMIELGTRGTMVNVASRLGVQLRPNASAYSIAKAGVVHMTRLMALELGPHGIRVNAIGPGPIPRTGAAGRSRRAPANGPLAPFLLGRELRFDDIPATVVYLASDASRMVTGQLIVIDGGLGLQGPV
ncbi:MAG: SDR family oxidoreductase [Gemmatimonadetes bacterium]|nr:SDR family oxidoreductase [Gemmatimonadota bacterium]